MPIIAFLVCMVLGFVAVRVIRGAFEPTDHNQPPEHPDDDGEDPIKFKW